MRCRWAAEERTCSHSGSVEVLLGILPPEAIPLRIRVLRVSKGDTKNLLDDGAVLQGNRTQLSPVLPLAAFYQIIEGGKRVTLVVQMPRSEEHTSELQS